MRTLTSVEPEETTAETKFGGKMLILRSCTQDEGKELMLNKQRAFLGEVVPGKGIKVTLK